MVRRSQSPQSAYASINRGTLLPAASEAATDSDQSIRIASRSSTHEDSTRTKPPPIKPLDQSVTDKDLCQARKPGRDADRTLYQSSATTSQSEEHSHESHHSSVYERWLAAFRPSQKLSICIPDENATDEPPISAASLAELELCNIAQNPRLRHDLNFDHEVHFRPNTDGAKGQQKILTAVEYWKAMRLDLELMSYMLSSPNGKPLRWTHEWKIDFALRQNRLKRLFVAVKEILKTLAPDTDQNHIEEGMDIPLIMQQIEHGVFDVGELSKWLAGLLKEHCAPMRDPLVDRMVEQTERGSETGDAEATTDGLKQLLGILEYMKLDVANHQIRHLRHMLLEFTIQFEQKYWIDKMRKNHADVDAAGVLAWCLNSAALHSTLRIATPDTTQQAPPISLEIYIKAFVAALMPASNRNAPNRASHRFPRIFKLDFERLNELSAEIQTEILASICMSRFRAILHQMNPNEAKQQGADFQLSVAREQKLLEHNIPLILNTRMYGPFIHSLNAGHVATELVRTAHNLLSASTASGERITTCDLDFNTRLQQSPSCDGKSLLDLVDETEVYLLNFAHAGSFTFASHAAEIRRKLTKDITNLAKAHTSLSPAALFDALCVPATSSPTQTTETMWDAHGFAVGSVIPGRQPSAGSIHREDCHGPGFEGTTRRAAHVAILHWNVWAQLLYRAGEGGVFECEGDHVQSVGD